MADAASSKVRVVRTIPGPRDEVFQAWVEPDRLKQWFGPGGFTIPSAEMDVRPGGEYLIVMQPAEGDGMKLTGTFHEIEPPTRLVFTWSWRHVWAEAPESLVVVEFNEAPGGTEVVVTQGDFDTGDEGAPYQSGWDGGLDKLERLFGAAV